MGFINLIWQVKKVNHNSETSWQRTKRWAEQRVPARILKVKALTRSTLWKIHEPLGEAHPALCPALCLRQPTQASQQPHEVRYIIHRSQVRGLRRAECPESVFGIHYQQYNKQCLTAFDFQAIRNVFPKLLLEHGPYRLSASKPSAFEARSYYSPAGELENFLFLERPVPYLKAMTSKSPGED